VGPPAGGDHAGNLDEVVAQGLLLVDELDVVHGDHGPAAADAVSAVGVQDRCGQEALLHVLVEGSPGHTQGFGQVTGVAEELGLLLADLRLRRLRSFGCHGRVAYAKQRPGARFQSDLHWASYGPVSREIAHAS